MKQSSYTTFTLMLICSAISMYITMYFNTYEFDHIFFSWTRLYMTLIGIGGMAIIMFLFMKRMYKDKIKNTVLIVSSLAVMSTATFLVRQQIPVDDIKWMKAMIPHHSIAILTSKNADLKDDKVKKLANEIIETQKKEIAEMRKMIERLKDEE